MFVDGVGIGCADAAVNPFGAANLPALERLIGGTLNEDILREGGRHGSAAGVAVAIDATLGVAGRPQSGTGQTALLTGRNAPALFGRHFGSWVPTTLRALLASGSLFAAAQAAGRRTVFANAVPPPPPGMRRPAAFPYAAHRAGLERRGREALARGAAVPASLAADGWQAAGARVPPITPEWCGETLAGLAADADLTVFAHYATDAVGHRRDLAAGVAALELLDRFLGALLTSLDPGILLVVTSDHGNLEDARVGHTRNPVPLIAAGPGRERSTRDACLLTDVAPALLAHLGVAGPSAVGSRADDRPVSPEPPAPSP